jgi:hypothetical protein
VNRVARWLAQKSVKGLRALCYRVTRQVAEVLLVAAQALLEVSVGVRVYELAPRELRQSRCCAVAATVSADLLF